jgi:hypothetical protein
MARIFILGVIMQLETVERTPNLLIPDSGKPLTDRIAIRRDMMRDRSNYTFWGRALKIVFDPDGMCKPNPWSLDHPVIYPNWISWENDENFCGPVLALSLNQQDLLVIGEVKQPPEVFGKDRDDVSTWVPTNLPGWKDPRAGDPLTAGRMPRRYAQRYSDLTTEFIPNTTTEPNFDNPDCFLVLQPVHQILMKISGSIQPGVLTPETAKDGTKMAFLINPKTREAHLLGGKINLDLRLHTLPNGAKP